MKSWLAGLGLMLATSIAAADEPHTTVHFSLATAVTDPPPPKMVMRSQPLVVVGGFLGVGGLVTSVVGLGYGLANLNILSPTKDNTGPAVFFTGIGVLAVGIVLILVGAERVPES